MAAVLIGSVQLPKRSNGGTYACFVGFWYGKPCPVCWVEVTRGLSLSVAVVCDACALWKKSCQLTSQNACRRSCRPYFLIFNTKKGSWYTVPTPQLWDRCGGFILPCVRAVKKTASCSQKHACWRSCTNMCEVWVGGVLSSVFIKIKTTPRSGNGWTSARTPLQWNHALTVF